MSTTLQRLASHNEAKARLIREWLAIYGANYRQEVSAAQARIYEEYLGDVPERELREGLERALLECRYFPNVADIRSCLRKPAEESLRVEEARDSLEAERAWKGLEGRRDRWGMDLTPVFSGGKFTYPPALDAATEHALAAIGGWERFCNYEHDLYGLMRKDFFAAYKYHSSTGGLLAPSRGEAARLLGQVARQLPAPTAVAERE